MARATWMGATIAESDATIVIEGNHYVPPDAVHPHHIAASATQTTCPWKGTASYYDVVVNDDRNAGAAWYYPTPKSAAAEIAGYVAFWRGVQVTP